MEPYANQEPRIPKKKCQVHGYSIYVLLVIKTSNIY